MKSGAIRGEQVFQVCHVYMESVMVVTTIAILPKNVDDTELSTELSAVKTWAGPVSASQLPFFFQNTLCVAPVFVS